VGEEVTWIPAREAATTPLDTAVEAFFTQAKTDFPKMASMDLKDAGEELLRRDLLRAIRRHFA
jgi:hypothetical protein